MKKYIIICCCFILSGCKEMKNQTGTFGYDVEKLQGVEGLEILKEGDAMIAVSGIYQGRIFTSTAKGKQGKSYGWFNQEVIKKGVHAESMAGLGGESRLWFGPEFGQFSLCFEKGVEQVDKNMVRPHDWNHKKFVELKRSPNSLTFGGQMTLKNAQDFVFKIDVERTISVLSKDNIEKNLGIQLTGATTAVGFSAENKVTNIGTEPFKKESGLISIWELGCMLPTADNCVIIPLAEQTDQIPEYFDFTPTVNRMQIKDNVVFYKADAQGIHKIGVPPSYCKNIMGAYSSSNRQLDIVTFSFEKDSLYVNSIPKNTRPYDGDVINIFNGGVIPETGMNLEFYEFESSSSAKELKPNDHFNHTQTTYHFQGSFEALNVISKSTLGVDLSDVPNF